MVDVMTVRDKVTALECVPLPSSGRVFRAIRPVRLGDASPGGRCRLDSLARYLQDIAKDDGQDTGVTGNDLHGWVVRRTLIDVHAFPTYLQRLSLATWVAGLGSHWAERRTQMSDESGRVLVDASAIWVHIDMKTMRPKALTSTLSEVWGSSTGGREVGARQVVKPSVVRASGATRTSSNWVTRFSDFDALEQIRCNALQVLGDYLVRVATRNDHLLKVFVENVSNNFDEQVWLAVKQYRGVALLHFLFDVSPLLL